MTSKNRSVVSALFTLQPLSLVSLQGAGLFWCAFSAKCRHLVAKCRVFFLFIRFGSKWWWQHFSIAPYFIELFAAVCWLHQLAHYLLFLDEFDQTVCADRLSSMCSKQRRWRLLCASVVVVSWAASVESSLVYIQPLANCFGQDKGGMAKAWFIYQLFRSHSRNKRLCCCLNHFSLLKIEALWNCIFYNLRAADSMYFLHCYCPLVMSCFLNYYFHWLHLSFVHRVVSKIT